ncbi:hypothetical protein AX16_001877 [Volvariella volvacea WC 439]|nr:hypothetical protein AX16_001877 [Volvariella volvacea WC 439]
MTGPIRTHVHSSFSTDGEQPPRPPNAWILYRADKMREIPKPQPGEPRLVQADISRLISRMWKEESDETRAEYERRADAKKAEHAIRYPDYRFQPMSKEEKKEKREQKKIRKREGKRVSRGQTPTPAGPSSIASDLPTQVLPVPLSTVFHVAHPFGLPGQTSPVIITPTPQMQPKSEAIVPPTSTASLPTVPTPVVPPYAQPVLYNGVVPVHIYPSYWYSPRAEAAPTPYPPTPVSLATTPRAPSAQPQLPAPDLAPWPAQVSTPAPATGVPATAPVGDSSKASSALPDAPAVLTSATLPVVPEPGNVSTEPEFVSFEVDPYNFGCLGSSLAGEQTPFADLLEDFFNSQSVSELGGVYHLDMDNTQSLTSEPTGEIEVSIGQLPLEGIDFSAYNFEAPTSASTENQPTTSNPADLIAFLQEAIDESQVADNGDEFINYDLIQSFDAPTTVAPDALVQNAQQQQSAITQREYVPPSGAALSANRRVAGSWKPPFAADSPPRAWGVPAN